jgi:hypothetical protein
MMSAGRIESVMGEPEPRAATLTAVVLLGSAAGFAWWALRPR